MKPSKAVIVTQAQAERRLAYWQPRLRLADWTITVEIVRAPKLDTKDMVVLGHVEVLGSKQCAVVRLLDPIDFRADLGFVDHLNHERALIHELLHVRLHGTSDDSEAIRELSEEHAVHALSCLLEEFDAR